MAWRRGFSKSLPTNEPFKLKECLQSLSRIPKLVVLDLDFTCWPTHVDCMVRPPFRPDGKGGAVDSSNTKIGLFPCVYPIMTQLEKCDIPMAACSKTTAPSASYQLQTALGIKSKFAFSEVYPNCKVVHFEKLHKASAVPYEDMIFFDDEYGNIEDVSKLGVTSIYVDDNDGLTWSLFKYGLIQHNKKMNKST